jgi:CubicO group peptidase (beta-lactamase class C family)
MQDYRPADGEYVTGAASVHPAYPFKMSARDLARFALLYLRKGQWEGRQLVPAHWVEQSTQAYSSSEWGPGYGYLWWTGPINNGVAPSVSLPPGTYFAQGSGGQYALVIPAYDLVIVHRAAHVDDGVSMRLVGRLLWLAFDAGGFPDIGPDASIEAARSARVGGAALSRMLPGKTLLYGEAAPPGPHRIRIGADGRFAYLRGRQPTEVDTGSWSILGDEFCRDWKKIKPSPMCLAVVGNGAKIQLFDRMGLMLIDAQIVDD